MNRDYASNQIEFLLTKTKKKKAIIPNKAQVLKRMHMKIQIFRCTNRYFAGIERKNISITNLYKECNSMKAYSDLLSCIALIQEGKICCDACLVVLVAGDPARANSLRVGYTASNLSVA